ncbi:collagen binding domain-containing protein [Paenibacillus sp. GCM10012303]|uniref:collagen binding domain-containing protein n=1 Tax=Paenibacillus sp. GCM10012303 TaxID=3317340 RepID=UPI00361E92AD
MKKKRMSGLVLAWLLLFQTMFGGTVAWMSAGTSGNVQNSVYGQVTNAVYAPPVVNAGSILTKIVLTDQNGTVIDTVYNPGSSLDVGAAVNLAYEWELPNGHGYTKDSIFTFDLPSQFEIFTDINEPLVSGQGTVGHFTVSRDGKVVMTFNDYVESHSNVSGKLEIRTEFKKEVINGSTEVIIAIPVKGGVQTVIVHLKPKGGKLIDKQGQAAGKNQIDWKIQINKSLDTVKKAVVSDTLPGGLELIADSVKVYHLQVNGDGSAVTGALVDSSEYTVETNGTGAFKVLFRDETISKAYEVHASTRITGDQTKFPNTAVLSGEGIADVKATAEVTVQRGKFLEKSYKVEAATGIVTWTVKYNFSESKITQDKAIIEDQFSANHVWVSESLKVYKEATTELIPASAYQVTPTANGFKLQFKSDIDSAYTIVYQTKPVDRLTSETEKVTNKVVSNGTNVGVTVPVQKSRVLVKENRGTNYTDYKDKTTTWRLSMNEDTKPDGTKYSMDNVVLTDTFPNGGLEFLPDSLSVKAGGIELPKSDYTVESPDPRSGFVIKFNKTIDKTVTVEYKTKFNLGWKTDKTKGLINRASVTWTENGKSFGPINREATFTPDDYTNNNGSKDGTYDPVNKEITWNVKLNYNLDPIAGAKVTDVLGQSQTYVPDSVRVYEMTLTGKRNGVAKGSELPADRYEVIVPSEANGHMLTVVFKDDPLEKPYWITFKTTLKGALIEPEIHNTAKLMSGTAEVAKWNAYVKVPNGGTYVSKTGTQNNNKIDWTIRINEGQSHISNAKIIDNPSPNQILIEDSFRLYATKVNASGYAEKAGLLMRDTDYTLAISTISGNRETFVLSFTTDISTAYILEYQSFINAADKDKVENTVSLEGDRLTVEVRETSKEIIVRTSSGSGSGGGVTGSLEVTKVDKDDPAKPLAGAKFALYDKAEKRAPLVRTTDASGKLLFTGLLYDDYILEELAAPEGYTIDEKKRNVTIDSSITGQGNTKKITVTNSKKAPPVEPTGSLEVTKVDKDDLTKPLAGAKFSLSDKEGKRASLVQTTDADGKLLFAKLPYGDYVLEELEAPSGYAIDEKTKDVAIGTSATVHVKLTVTNSKKAPPVEPTGSLEVTKVDQDDSAKPLAGAEFSLSDKEGKRAPLVQTTDADGKLLFTKLPYGDYVLEELEAPAGYVIDTAKHTITIDAETVKVDNTHKVVVTNRKKPDTGNPENPGNGGNPGGGGNPGDDGEEPKEPVTPTTPVNPPTTGEPKTPVTPTNPPLTEVPDEEVPRGGPTPSQPPKEESTVEVEEEGVPRGGPVPAPTPNPSPTPEVPVSTLPKTGEASRNPFYLTGLALVALGIWLGRRQLKSK